MILLLDIGNTHTHLGIVPVGRARHPGRAGEAHGTARRGRLALPMIGKIAQTRDVPTKNWFAGTGAADLTEFLGNQWPTGAALCSVVPDATPLAVLAIQQLYEMTPLELTSKTVRGVGIDYPKPETIGPDRLANALAVRQLFGAPAVVVDFGTAVTFDVVNRKGNYVGGIIAPGLSAMTDYLHEKTALLPKIQIRDTRAFVGKSTEQAMLIGAVQGYRGMIRELLKSLRTELKAKRLPVVATGGYAKLIAAKLEEITAVRPHLTLEGLQIFYNSN
jgi:type III pantothenate kinase